MKRTLLLLLLLLVVCIGVATAQARQVTGKVLDETGQGLPGAGVNVRGTNVGTVTDVDGNFTISLPADNNVLVVQAVSYQRQEVTVTGNTVTVRMQSSSTQLQQTVVTALAVKRERREIGYSATTISNDDLTSGNNVSAISAIQGKTAGANITSSTGGPGGSSRIVLRGEKSIAHGNNALIVVDGVIINNSSRLRDNINSLEQVDFGNQGNDINPDDIESITVLKGPAAAALYGSAGANGAVMITTKSGRNRKKTGKTEITYKSTFTLSDVLRYPEMQHQYGQGNIYAIEADRRENFSWGLPFDGQLRPWGQIIDGQQKVKPYSDQPNNIKDFFNRGKTWENYLSLAGGSETSNYFLSLNALDNTGIVPNTFYNKYGIRFNGATQLTNKFYSSISLDYVNISQRVEAQGQALGSTWQNVLQTPRDIPMNELRNLDDPFNCYGCLDPNGVPRYGYYGAYTENPFWVAKNYDNRDRSDRVLGNVTLGFKPNNHFNIFDRFGADILADRATFKEPKYDLQAYDPFWADNDKISQGGYEQTNNNVMLLNNDVIATYDRPVSDKISINALAGNNMQVQDETFLGDVIDPKTNGLVVPDFYNLQNAQGPVTASNSITQRRIIGLYGSFKINYDRALFLEMTARNDWTSALSENNRSFFYPSVNASWVFTEHWKSKFTENVLTYGKLRGNYASVGTGALAYENNQPRFISTTSGTSFGSVLFPFNGQPGYTFQNTIGNPELQPERTNSWEIGTDLSFLHDRISIELTYYNSRSIDQIVSIPTAPSSGYTAQVINTGEIQNKGIEASLHLTPIRTASGFRWELYGTYYKNDNKVLSLSNGVSQIVVGGYSGLSITAAVGKPYGAFYATDFMNDGNGHVVIDPSSGLPRSSTSTVYKGTYQPKFIASWGTTLTFKGLSLNVLFTTKQGGVFYSQTKQYLDFVGVSKETENRAEQIFPNSVYQDANGAYVTNTQYTYRPYDLYTVTGQNVAAMQVLNASYVKLQEASLYYTIPVRAFDHSPFGGISVGVFGNNLLLWTAKDNVYVDPEVNSGGASNEQGFDFAARPSLRNYGVSLRVTF